MEQRTMTLDEECRYYNEQRERINKWKELNQDRLEQRTLTDYVRLYDEQISKLVKSGAPEDIVANIRAERNDLLMKLKQVNDRIVRSENALEQKDNKNWTAQSVLKRWLKEAREDKLDTETQLDMEIGFLRRFRERVAIWTGDLLGQLAAQIQVHARARSINDIEKEKGRILQTEAKMKSLEQQSAKRLRFKRGIWAFRKAIGHRPGIEPVAGNMSPTERGAYNEYAKERDDHIKALAAAQRRKEQAEKSIYEILRYRPDLMLKSRYVQLDEELQADSTWYKDLLKSEEEKDTKKILDELDNDEKKTPEGPEGEAPKDPDEKGHKAPEEKEPKEPKEPEEKEPKKREEKDPPKDPEKGAKGKDENTGLPDMPYHAKKAINLDMRTITGHGRIHGMDYFIERGAKQAPRAYIRIPEDTGISGLYDLRQSPMDHNEERSVKLPKAFKELFSSFAVETSHRDLDSSFEKAQNEGDFVILEFREKGEDGKWKRFSDQDIRGVIDQSIQACDKYNSEHTYNSVLSMAAIETVTARLQQSCEMRDSFHYEFRMNSSWGASEHAKDTVQIQFHDGAPHYYINGNAAKQEDVAAMITNPIPFVDTMYMRLDREERDFWQTIHDRPKEVVALNQKHGWSAMLGEAQALFYNEAFKNIDAEMKGLTFELPGAEPGKNDCYGLAFSEKGYPVYTLNGTDVPKKTFERYVSKNGPGFEEFKKAFETALEDKQEQLTEIEKTKEREKTGPGKGRGD